MMTERELKLLTYRYANNTDVLTILDEVRGLQASLERHQDKLLEVSAKHVAAENMAGTLAKTMAALLENIPKAGTTWVETLAPARHILAAYREWKERATTEREDAPAPS